MNIKRFSPERLYHIRRLRKARRYFKQTPLFAYQRMVLEYPGYAYEAFLKDLRFRTKPKKRKGKSSLCRYGRYRRMEKLLSEFRLTGDHDFIRRAMQLRKHITQPYRVRYQIGREVYECCFSPMIPIEQIEGLVLSLRNSKTLEEAEQLIDKFNSYPSL